MATLDGKEIPQCVRCTQFKPDARERTVTKGDAEMKRVLCDGCAAVTNETYPVKPLRQSARAVEDATPLAATESTTSKKTKED